MLPTVNTQAMQVFLNQVAASRPPNIHLVMVLDGAGWHQSKDLAVPASITLVVLPPYSPELNPIENLWHYLKSHFWSNRAYDDYAALEEAAMDAWRAAVLDEELIKSVCAAPYTESAANAQL